MSEIRNLEYVPGGEDIVVNGKQIGTMVNEKIFPLIQDLVNFVKTDYPSHVGVEKISSANWINQISKWIIDRKYDYSLLIVSATEAVNIIKARREALANHQYANMIAHQAHQQEQQNQVEMQQIQERLGNIQLQQHQEEEEQLRLVREDRQQILEQQLQRKEEKKKQKQQERRRQKQLQQQTHQLEEQYYDSRNSLTEYETDAEQYQATKEERRRQRNLQKLQEQPQDSERYQQEYNLLNPSIFRGYSNDQNNY